MMYTIFRVLKAMANGYAVSRLTSWGQEILAGGAPQKGWLFLIQFIFLMISFEPLYFVFPAATLTLNFIYYPLIIFLAGINFVASICQMNQEKKRVGSPDSVQKLPFGLDESELFSHLMINLSHYLTYVFYALYPVTLILAFFAGFKVFVLASVAMILIDQLYQYRWFPSFLETPYFLLGASLRMMVIFGFSNPFWIAMNVLNTAFFIVDYIQTHLRGAWSASSQFSVADPQNELTLKSLSKPLQDKQSVQNLLDSIKDKKVHVTFNHFREPWMIKMRMFGEPSKTSYSNYLTYFNALDFSDPSLRERIQNEMVIHNNFNNKSLADHRNELQLSEDTELVDVQIAFLKKEMAAVVSRLENPVNKALMHQKIDILLGESRGILSYLETLQDQKQKEYILLTIAMQTGSQCWRAYLEAFSDLFNAYVCKNAPMSIKERAHLTIQSVREDLFKRYYYEMREKYRYYQMIAMDPGFLLNTDANDYHTYENFAFNFGTYFYLQNYSLSLQTRDITDIISDYLNTYFQLPTMDALQPPVMGRNVGSGKYLFSHYYESEALINTIVDPEGKMHPVFKTWCESLYPEMYNDFLLDGDLFPIAKNSSEWLVLRNLARLMLLDLGIVEFGEVPETKNVISLITSVVSFFTGEDTSRNYSNTYRNYV